MRWDETYRAQRCLVDHRYSVNMNSVLPLLLSTCWSFSCSTKKMEQRRWRKQRLLNRARATVKAGLLLVCACSWAFRCSENRFQDHLTATAASSESHLQTRHRLLHARCLTQLREIQTIKEQNGVAIWATSLRGELQGGDPQLWRISVAGCAHWGESHHNHEPGTRYAYSHSASLFSQVSIYPQENQHRQLTENPGGAFRPSPYSGLRGPTWLSCRPLPWLGPTPHCPHCTWPPRASGRSKCTPAGPLSGSLLTCSFPALTIFSSMLPPYLRGCNLMSSILVKGKQAPSHFIMSSRFISPHWDHCDFLCSDHRSLFCLLSCLLC